MARINRFFSRSDIGLRAPRSVSRNITPQHGGVAVHWGGPRQGTTGSSCNCASTWRNWQNFHMNSRGWADIAYNFGFCNHGNVFAGRGFSTRSAANGTNAGNQNYYAACWIGGQGETPSKAARDALSWIVLEARNKGRAGRGVLPHSRFTGSTCPGQNLTNYAATINNKTISGGEAPPPATVDIWEELGLSDLTNAEKDNLRRLAKTPAAHLERWAEMGLTKTERENVKSMFNYLAREDVRGDSFARQLLQFHREERPTLQGIIEHIQAKGTSVQGFVRGATNLFRYARDKENWSVDTQ